jgi:hypothetical protein
VQVNFDEKLSRLAFVCSQCGQPIQPASHALVLIRADGERSVPAPPEAHSA